MLTIKAPILEVQSSPNHPSAVKSGEKNILNFPDYSFWNSIGNIKRYIEEQAIAKTKSGVLIMNKEAPYSAEMDFMSLIDLPPISLEVFFNGEKYDFDENMSLEEIIFELGGNENLNYNGNIGDKFLLNYRKNITFLEKNFEGLVINLKAHTVNGIKIITPETQVAEVSPIGWGDLEKNNQFEKKRDIQELITSYFSNSNPEKGKSIAAGFNYTKARKNGIPTGKDGGADSQSLKNLHIHFFQVDGVGEDKELTRDEDLAFHDYYISKAFKEHGFNWSNIDFKTLEPLDNKKNNLNKQGILLKVNEFGTEAFWEDFDKVIKVVEDLNINTISFDDFIKSSGNLSIEGKVENILGKINYNDLEYSEIVTANKKLFSSIINGIIEKENYVGGKNRKKGDDIIPFPNFGYTLSIQKYDNGGIELKIIPRIHTRGAVVEALGMKLERVASENEEDFKNFMNKREKSNINIIKKIGNDIGLEYTKK